MGARLRGDATDRLNDRPRTKNRSASIGETKLMATRPPSQYYIPGLATLYANFDEWAHVLIRVALGAVLIPHGMQKLFGAFGGPGMAGFIGAMQKVGYSPAMATLFRLADRASRIRRRHPADHRPVHAPGRARVADLYAGSCSRFHYGVGGFFWTGRGNEYPMILAAISLYLLIRGAGPYSVDAKMGKEF